MTEKLLVFVASVLCTLLGIVFTVLFIVKQKFLVDGSVVALVNCTHDCDFLAPYGRVCTYLPTFSVAWSYNASNYTESSHNLPWSCDDCCNASVGAPLSVEIDPHSPSAFLALWPAGDWRYYTSFETAMIVFFMLALLCWACTFVAIFCNGNRAERIAFAHQNT